MNQEKSLTLYEYQEKAMTTCMATSENPLYMLFGLQGEVGELAGKFAKLIRKGYIKFDGNQVMLTDKLIALPQSERDQIGHDIKSELGDVAWMLAGACAVLGYSLDEICRLNLAKLADRKQRGVIDGNGDNR